MHIYVSCIPNINNKNTLIDQKNKLGNFLFFLFTCVKLLEECFPKFSTDVNELIITLGKCNFV